MRFIFIVLLGLSLSNCISAESRKSKKSDESNLSIEDKISSDINRLFNEKMPEMLGNFRSMSSFKMNMLESGDAYHIDAELPGVKKEDIQINLKGDSLVISGEKKSYLEEKKNNYSLVERSNGKFTRSITLPSDVDKNKITSKLEDGVLKIDIGKEKNMRPSTDKKIEIL